MRHAPTQAGRQPQVRAGASGSRQRKPYLERLLPRTARHGRRRRWRYGRRTRLAALRIVLMSRDLARRDLLVDGISRAASPRIPCTISHLYSAPLGVVVGPSLALPVHRGFGTLVVRLCTILHMDFAELTFRNCLENSWKASRGCVVGARRGR